MLNADLFSPCVVKKLGEIFTKFICLCDYICSVQVLKNKINASFSTNLGVSNCLGGCFCFVLQSPGNKWVLLDGRQNRKLDPETCVFSVRCTVSMPVGSRRDLVREIAAALIVGIWAHSRAVHHEIQKMSRNGVSGQTIPPFYLLVFFCKP